MITGHSNRAHLITDRKEFKEDQVHFADQVADVYEGNIVGPYSILLHSPDLASRIVNTASYVRFESTLPKVVYKLAVLTATRELNCNYAWQIHHETAISEGVREGALAAIRDRRAPQDLMADEECIVRYVQELLRNNRISDKTFKAVRDNFTIQQMVDLTVTIGHYGTLAAVLNAFEVDP